MRNNHSMQRCAQLDGVKRLLTSRRNVVRCTRTLCKKSNDDSQSELVKETVQELKRAEIDPGTAADILKLWKQNGVTDDPEELRKLFQQRGYASLARVTLQLLLDAGASFAANMAASALSSGDEFFGRGVLVFIFYAIAFNYALATLSNLVSFAISLRSMSKFGVNAAAYLEAVKHIAGESGGLDSVDRVKRAIDGFKVASALQKMDTYLKDRSQQAALDKSPAATLDSLAVYLTLDKARRMFDFEPEQFGLSEEEAVNIARMFSKFDTNDDFRIDVNELERLCDEAGRSLTREEAQAALKALDENGDGYVDFPEFVAFWVNPDKKVDLVPKTEAPVDSNDKTQVQVQVK
eukprot:TRINITY_DN17514_c0_g1_i1.p1 TRINITY_DN17514_c0_g1~~TRINITY_DN17514_c0_g1_i1.p1  ORF type:complete len:378 (-),score=48.34 TRINITY_DN17514_c0_g1_i1:292-1341(-)